jgi:hypothetical protein
MRFHGIAAGPASLTGVHFKPHVAPEVWLIALVTPPGMWFRPCRAIRYADECGLYPGTAESNVCVPRPRKPSRAASTARASSSRLSTHFVCVTLPSSHGNGSHDVPRRSQYFFNRIFSHMCTLSRTRISSTGSFRGEIADEFGILEVAGCSGLSV